MSAHEKELRANFMESAIARGREEGASLKIAAGLAGQIYKRHRPRLGEAASKAEVQERLMTVFRDALGQLMRGREEASAEHDDEWQERARQEQAQRDQPSSARRYHGDGPDDLAEYIKGHPPTDE